jgi:DNA-binding PadR family transcriptional regulator
MTNAELAILGLVAEAPRHGYEMEQLIEERGMRNWTEVGFSSIYYILNKLEQRGLIRSHREPAAGRGPARKVYSIQPEGQKAWHQATLQMLSVPRTGSPFLLGLAGIPGIQPQEVVTALRQYRRELIKRRDQVEETWQQNAQLPVFLEGMYEYGFNLAQAEIEWLDRYIPRLESQIES